MSTKKIIGALAAARSCILSGESFTETMHKAFEEAADELEAIECASKAWVRPMSADRTEWAKMGDTLTAIARDVP